MTNQGCPTPAAALALAETIFSSRYAGASFAFVAGSIMRGQGTYFSDVDLVVVYDHLEAARRESFVIEGVPVEAFVHDVGTLEWFVNEDVSRGRPSILNMIVEGTAIGHAPDRAEILRCAVSERLENGPRPLAPADLDALRYEITDALDDLRGDRSQSEMMAIGVMLYPKLVELALRGRGQWNGIGKWAPRLLSAADRPLAQSFEDGFQKLFVSGKADLVIALAESELKPHGGPLFDGDCRTAPASWRA